MDNKKLYTPEEVARIASSYFEFRYNIGNQMESNLLLTSMNEAKEAAAGIPKNVRDLLGKEFSKEIGGSMNIKSIDRILEEVEECARSGRQSSPRYIR